MATALDAPVTLDGKHTVLTPEYVEFNFVLAGLMSRFLALLIDTVLSVVITYALFIVVFVLSLLLSAGTAAVGGASAGSSLLGLGMAAQFVIWFLIDWGHDARWGSTGAGAHPRSVTGSHRRVGPRVPDDTAR